MEGVVPIHPANAIVRMPDVRGQAALKLDGHQPWTTIVAARDTEVLGDVTAARLRAVAEEDPFTPARNSFTMLGLTVCVQLITPA
jgi:hypothetical protein